MRTTNYVGKVIDNRVLLICEDDEHTKIQIPHIDMMREDGLTAVAYPNAKLKAPFKYLTTKELACFFMGKSLTGEVLETPAQARARHEEWVKNNPDLVKELEELKKRIRK